MNGRLYEVPGQKQWAIVQSGGLLLTWSRGIEQSWKEDPPVDSNERTQQQIEQEKERKGFVYTGTIQIDPDNGPTMIEPVTTAPAPSSMFYLSGNVATNLLTEFCLGKGIGIVQSASAIIIGSCSFCLSNGFNNQVTAVLRKDASSDVVAMVLLIGKQFGFQIATDDEVVDIESHQALRESISNWLGEGYGDEGIWEKLEQFSLLPKEIRWGQDVTFSESGSLFF